MLDLPRRWLSPGGGALPWGSDGPGIGIYAQVPMEALPPLRPCDGSFAWLPPLSPGIKGMANAMWELEGEANVRAHLAALDSEARALGDPLPAEFVRFMTTPSLFGRVASCTGCYFDLLGDSDSEDDDDVDDDDDDYDADDAARTVLVPVPGHPGNARLLCFMSELASRWYLLLDGTDPPRVVTGWIDPDDDDRLVDLAVCADSFETFIRRFWIENLLWFRHDAGEPATGELRAYLDEARMRHSSVG